MPSSIGVVADEFDLSTITTGDLVFAGAAVVTAILISQITKRAMRRVLDDLDGVPVMAGNVIARIVSYIILTMGLVVALEALGFSSGLVGSMLLLVIIVVVFAAKPLLQDLGAGLIIQLRRPFGVGDLVAIGAVEGEVEEVSARTVRLITVDGRRVHLPNRSVLDGAITNLTNEGRRLTTFIVGAAYDTDLDLARQVIVEALDSSPLVLSDPPPQAFVEDFADSTINIACRFWHQPQVQAEWAARDESMRAVKRALDDAGITIAFPQRVLWVQPTED
ncbi:MAG: mechanosensitive ion channel family protein [Actinomycetia bacterium]|nr:mechanosensitive ion channel family protein [Actinomycetes bacterium]MCP4084042.1 mechanosensitive ion channel family protein [Actinomycetes bacterium]